MLKVRREPSIVADPGDRKRIADEELWCTGFFVILKCKHSYILEYTAKR